jgi:hypothetical protein
MAGKHWVALSRAPPAGGTDEPGGGRGGLISICICERKQPKTREGPWSFALLAAVLVSSIGIRHALYLAAVPGAFAVVAITLAARASREKLPVARRTFSFEFRRLRKAGLLRPMVPVAACELGNVATTLLILRAMQLLQRGGLTLTAATSLAVLIYAAHNAFGAVVAAIGGHWID